MLKTTLPYLAVAFITSTLLSACGGSSEQLEYTPETPLDRLQHGKIYGSCNSSTDHLPQHVERCDTRGSKRSKYKFGKSSILTRVEIGGKPEDNKLVKFVNDVNKLLNSAGIKAGDGKTPLTVSGKLNEQITEQKLNITFEFDNWVGEKAPREAPLMIWPTTAKTPNGKVEIKQKGIDDGVFPKAFFQSVGLTLKERNGENGENKVYEAVSAPSTIKIPITMPRNLEVDIEVRDAVLKAKVTEDAAGKISMEGEISGKLQKTSIRDAITKMEKHCETKADCLTVSEADNSCKPVGTNACDGDTVCKAVAKSVCGQEDSLLNNLNLFENGQIENSIIKIQTEAVTIDGLE